MEFLTKAVYNIKTNDANDVDLDLNSRGARKH